MDFENELYRIDNPIINPDFYNTEKLVEYQEKIYRKKANKATEKANYFELIGDSTAADYWRNEASICYFIIDELCHRYCRKQEIIENVNAVKMGAAYTMN